MKTLGRTKTDAYIVEITSDESRELRIMQSFMRGNGGYCDWAPDDNNLSDDLLPVLSLFRGFIVGKNSIESLRNLADSLEGSGRHDHGEKERIVHD